MWEAVKGKARKIRVVVIEGRKSKKSTGGKKKGKGTEEEKAEKEEGDRNKKSGRGMENLG